MRRTRLFVGDQIFTDVYGANRTGIRTILVKADPSEGGDPDCLKALSGKNRSDFSMRYRNKLGNNA